jgi:hypothetical protein
VEHNTDHAAQARPLSEFQAAVEARRIIDEAYRPVPAVTSYRDDSPVPATGPTPPVPQPDQRIVPAWAAGVAVASVGVGAGVTGLGCGAWLLLQGLSAVTLWGVLAVVAPFAGVAMVATAIGAAVSRARAGVSTHIYQAPVTKHTELTTHTRGMFSRTRNELHG